MSKNILITGATGNLGTAISQKLCSLNYTVFGTVQYGHAQPECSVDFFECDLEDELETQELFKQLKAKYKTLDAAILLVGGFAMGNILHATSKDMMDMLKLNYMTAFHCAREAYDWMNRSYGGQIVFIGAKPAVDGGAAEVLPYAVSKSAVLKLSEIINESANEKIRSSVIVPSIIDTPENRRAMPNTNFADWVTPDEIADVISKLIAEKDSESKNPVYRIYNKA